VRIAIVSKADSFGGGASRVAEDLAEAYRQRGHLAVHWVSWTKKGYDLGRRRLYGELWQRRLYRWSRAVKSWFAPDLIPFELPNLYLQNLPGNYDVVHFHDISSAASPLTIGWFARRMPTLWTFHDCSPFTGGCLYPLDCERYRTGCSRCPQHGRWPIDSRFDYSALSRGVRRRVLDGPVNLLAPSHWMADMAAATLGRQPEVLPNGIDTATFRPPEDKEALRARLGLPGGRVVVLLSAASLSSPYKGMHHAIHALTSISDLRPLVLLVGEVASEVKEQLANLDVHVTGFIGEAPALAAYYGAADYFVCPSVAENMPLVVLETMACGVPTIGFQVGGIPEIVEDGVNGRLVPIGDGAALARELRRAIVEQLALAWGVLAAERIAKHFTLTQMADRHLEVYEKAIAPFRDKES
jgi:glycosyltransferase involved in cell wall biosynthesis